MEVLFEFVESCAESSELFEVGEGSFDAVACAIERPVELTLGQPPPGWRNDCLDASACEVLEDVVHVIALVGEHGAGRQIGEKGKRLCAIIALSAGEQEAEGTAQRIRKQVDLGRQTSSAAPQSGLRSPFFRAVAACWCARTMLESIIR